MTGIFSFFKKRSKVQENTVFAETSPEQPSTPRAQVIFLGTPKYQLHGNGKQIYFIEVAEKILWSEGISTYKLTDIDSIFELNSTLPTVVCQIYNEEDDDLRTVFRYEETCRRYFRLIQIIHPISLAMVLRDKTRTHNHFSEYGVPVPKLLTNSNRKSEIVFSNLNIGTNREIFVLDDSAKLDESRYNIEFVDTRVAYKGRNYYISVRLMCFGPVLVAPYLRCRPETDGDPSVRDKYTPKDPELLNYLYASIIQENLECLVLLSKKIGSALGPGFFAHDTLFCGKTGKFFVCESGFKFDAFTMGSHFENLHGKLVMAEMFDNVESIKMTYAFLNWMLRVFDLSD